MPHPITTTITLGAADADGIAESQTLAAAGTLDLDGTLVVGGVAVMDVPRRIIITSAGDDSGMQFIITGTAREEQGGIVQTETLAGGDTAEVASTLDFATVTEIAGTAATDSTVTAGTNSTASGPWVVWDMAVQPYSVSVAGFILSGSPTWQIDETADDPYGTWLPSNISAPRAFADPTLTGQTAQARGVISTPWRATRLTLTQVGGVQVVQQQAGG